MTASPTGRFVGIDVVDLAHARCVGKHEDARFLRRVLSEAELEDVSVSGEPARKLWQLWAAKEAAFKVASKVRPKVPAFVHAAFRVAADGPGPGRGFGRVSWEELSLPVHWHQQGDRVAALAWNGATADAAVEWGWGAASDLDPDPHAPLDALLVRFTARERRPVHSRPSALVRLAARAALATALDVAEARVEVVCKEGPTGRIPPEALLDGHAAPADVSLSHHGRWLAWAVRLAGPQAREGGADR